MKWALGSLAFCGLAYGMVNYFSASPPVAQAQHCRQMISDAGKAGAAGYAAGEFRNAEKLYDLALTEWKYQNEKIKSLRTYDSVNLLLHLSIAAAEKAAAKTNVKKDSLRQAIKKDLDFLEKSLSAFRGDRLNIPLGKETVAQLSECQLLAHECRSLYERSEYRAAAGKIEAARKLHEAIMRETGRTLEHYFERSVLWQRWIEETIAWSLKHKSSAIIVDKIDHKCYVYRSGKRILVLDVELGKNWMKDKMIRGDKATPEGIYAVIKKLDKGSSKFYKALLINYPNEEDRKRFDKALKAGLIPRNSAIGGLIEIHGDGGRGADWTDGCVAVSNADMDKLFNIASAGMPVAIVGSFAKSYKEK